MTLCIAAACTERSKDRVIIGTDWRIESEISAGADIQDKLYWIADDMPVLVSGNVTRGMELRDSYRTILESWQSSSPPRKLTYKNIRDFIKAGARRFKRELANEVATFACGLSFEEMRKAVAKKEIPNSVSVSIYRSIEKVNFECDVIIISFLEGRQHIFQVEKTGNFLQCDSFATIGEGAYVAQAALYLRKHSPDHGLHISLYHVFEAMHLASQCVTSVSEDDHTINVLYPPSEHDSNVCADYLTAKGFAAFKKLYKKKFGMRRVQGIANFPNEILKKDF